MMSPLIASAQNVCISLPGSEPDIEEDIDEDLSLLKDLPVMTNKKRRNYFSKRVNLLRYTYDPMYVYTFDFFENAFNFSTFQVTQPLLLLIVADCVCSWSLASSSTMCSSCWAPCQCR